MAPGTRTRVDVVVVGGGIIGLATADALTTRLPGSAVTVLEKEPTVATHQTGRNSGVVHAGIYYAPGSLKAELAVRGGDRLIEFCAEHGIAHDRCGKLVVATTDAERPRLNALAEQARANGVAVTTLTPDAAHEHEPHVACVAAMHVAATGRADFAGVAHALAGRIIAEGGEVRTGVTAGRATPTAGGWNVETADGPLRARFLVGCAGLQADRVARRSGATSDVRILAFRGEYLGVTGRSADLVHGLVYPVPDPRFPFLGVHLTRSLDGHVHAGPNAVLALAREGYRWSDISLRDLASTLAWPGTAPTGGSVLATRPGRDGAVTVPSTLRGGGTAAGPRPRRRGRQPGACRRACPGGRQARSPAGRLPPRRRRTVVARPERTVTGRHGITGDRRPGR